MLKELCVKWEEGKINQICAVVWNLEKTIEKYWNNMGFGPWYIWEMYPPDLHDYYYRGVEGKAAFRVALAQIGPIQYEILQPLYGMEVDREHLKNKGEGISHIKIYYEDIPKAKEMFASKGINVLQEGRNGPEDWFVYLDTEKEFGIIWEIGNCKDIGEPLKKYPK